MYKIQALKYLKIITLLITISICLGANAEVKQTEFGGLKLGVRVDEFGIKLSDSQSEYKYKNKYILTGFFDKPGHPIFAIELLCKEAQYGEEAIGGVGCSDNIRLIKQLHGKDILTICDDIRYDNSQTPYAYYNPKTNHFWIFSDDKTKILAIGITDSEVRVPGTEARSQVCQAPTPGYLAAKRAEEAEAKRIAIKEQQIRNQKIENVLKKISSMRRSPWVSWTRLSNSFLYAYDPKSVEGVGNFKRALTLYDSDDGYILVSIVELNCKDESYRELSAIEFLPPIQKQQVKNFRDIPKKWNYLERETIESDLYKKVCL